MKKKTLFYQMKCSITLLNKIMSYSNNFANLRITLIAIYLMKFMNQFS